MEQGKRNVNMEVLRVVAMFLIVAGHYIYTGVRHVMDPTMLNVTNGVLGGVNYVTLELLCLIAAVGVDCFVMISGYFLIEKAEMRWRGLLKTWVQTLFYSVVIFLIGIAIAPSAFSLELLLKTLFPIHQVSYWFVTYYIGLLFLAPFLARLAACLTKRQYQWLLAVLFVFCFIYLYGTVYLYNMHLGLFVFLFFVAGYIRKYSVPEWWRRHAGWIVMAVWATLFLMLTAVNVIQYLRTGIANFRLYSTDNNGPLFFLALSVFVWFVCHKPFTQRLVVWSARLGVYTFGVYLIHQHFFVNDPLWTYAIHTYTMQMPLLLHCLLWSGLVFAACIVIDVLRARLFWLLGVDHAIDAIVARLPKL